jgi:branched-chain amino acid transport system permease protein
MSAAFSVYLVTVALYILLYIIGGWGLNLQFGSAGILNFGYIIFVAIGAYAVALLTIGQAGLNAGSQRAFMAVSLPFPLPLIIAALAGTAASAVVGAVVLRRVRRDYQAMVLFVLTLVCFYVVTAIPGLLNGPAGLALIPQPLAPSSAPGAGYEWLFVAVVAVLTLLCWLAIRAVTESPYGRALRAMRERDDAAEALGYNVFWLRFTAFCGGGTLAALTGAIWAYFLTTWGPPAWGYQETFWFFTVVIVGGVGNLGGICIGSVIVVGLLQAFQYLPGVDTSTFGVVLPTILLSLAMIAFLWMRPRGIFPERLHRIYSKAPGSRKAWHAVAARAQAVKLAGVPARALYSRRGRPTMGHRATDGTRLPSAKPHTIKTGELPAVPMLRAVGLRKTYGGVVAVNDVSFRVGRNEIFALVGPNGAGKSTLGGLLAGSAHGTGEVWLDGKRVDGLPSWKRARAGLLRTFQLSNEFGELTVLENLLVAGRLREFAKFRLSLFGRRSWQKVERLEVTRARDLLNQFGLLLYEEEKARRLSSGQRRLVEIMRALMGKPKILLLDEPMAGLSEAMIQEVMQQMLRLRTEGLGMILIEHNVDVVVGIADRVCTLSSGQVLVEGTPQEVISNDQVMEVYLRG